MSFQGRELGVIMLYVFLALYLNYAAKISAGVLQTLAQPSVHTLPALPPNQYCIHFI